MQIHSEERISPDRVQLSFDEHGHFFPVYPSPHQLLTANNSSLSQTLKKFTTQTFKHEDLNRTDSPLKSGKQIGSQHKKSTSLIDSETAHKKSPLKEIHDLNINARSGSATGVIKEKLVKSKSTKSIKSDVSKALSRREKRSDF